MSAMLSAGIARNPSTLRFRSTRDDAKLAILRHANSGSTAKNERAARFGDPHPFIRRALGRRAPMPFPKMHLICESEEQYRRDRGNRRAEGGFSPFLVTSPLLPRSRRLPPRLGTCYTDGVMPRDRPNAKRPLLQGERYMKF